MVKVTVSPAGIAVEGGWMDTVVVMGRDVAAATWILIVCCRVVVVVTLDVT